MQTTITIDDNLIEEAAKLANTQNKSLLIELALSEFIKHHQPGHQKSRLLERTGTGQKHPRLALGKPGLGQVKFRSDPQLHGGAGAFIFA